MILVDTCIWVDHFKINPDPILVALLNEGRVLGHSSVTGEMALGNLQHRTTILDLLRGLPQAEQATDNEVFLFIEHETLFGMGIGFVDVHLLASARLSYGVTIWTRDKHLRGAATRLGLAANMTH